MFDTTTMTLIKTIDVADAARPDGVELLRQPGDDNDDNEGLAVFVP